MSGSANITPTWQTLRFWLFFLLCIALDALVSFGPWKWNGTLRLLVQAWDKVGWNSDTLTTGVLVPLAWFMYGMLAHTYEQTQRLKEMEKALEPPSSDDLRRLGRHVEDMFRPREMSHTEEIKARREKRDKAREDINSDLIRTCLGVAGDRHLADFEGIKRAFRIGLEQRSVEMRAQIDRVITAGDSAVTIGLTTTIVGLVAGTMDLSDQHKVSVALSSAMLKSVCGFLSKWLSIRASAAAYEHLDGLEAMLGETTAKAFGVFSRSASERDA